MYSFALRRSGDRDCSERNRAQVGFSGSKGTTRWKPGSSRRHAESLGQARLHGQECADLQLSALMQSADGAHHCSMLFPSDMRRPYVEFFDEGFLVNLQIR